jgi:hypothetical protein
MLIQTVIVPWMMSLISSDDDYWHSEVKTMMMNVKYDYHEDNDHETSQSTIICSDDVLYYIHYNHFNCFVCMLYLSIYLYDLIALTITYNFYTSNRQLNNTNTLH